MTTHGKLSIKGCSNLRDERHALNIQARTSSKKQRQIEKNNFYMLVPILKGVMEVEVSKFYANEEKYNALATGEIKRKN